MCELKKKRGLIAAFSCVAIILVLFLSSFYIAAERNHSCTGEDCPICMCIRQCESCLKQLGAGNAGGRALTAVLSVLEIVSVVLYVATRTTLVSQKVRMNN